MKEITDCFGTIVSKEGIPIDLERGMPFSIGEKVLVNRRVARVSGFLVEGKFCYVQIERPSGQKTYVNPNTVHFDPR